MDVQIGEVHSTVRTTDSQTLISPEVLEHIVNTVLARVRAEQAHAARVKDELLLRPGATAEESPAWK